MRWSLGCCACGCRGLTLLLLALAWEGSELSWARSSFRRTLGSREVLVKVLPPQRADTSTQVPSLGPGPFHVRTKVTGGQGTRSCRALPHSMGVGSSWGCPGLWAVASFWALQCILAFLISGFCSPSLCALLSQTCHCFGTYVFKEKAHFCTW